MRASRPKVAIAAVAVAALAVAGCAESDRESGSGGNSKKDTLVFGAAGDPKVLDPSFASDGESLRVHARSSRRWSVRRRAAPR